MVKKIKQNTPADPQIALLTQKVAEVEANYLRILADFQNQERRHKELESQVVKMANASLIEKMLFVLDSLQLAQSHLQDKGLTMIMDQFVKILESEGLKKIETQDKDFDPHTMECTETIDGEKDKVLQTVSDGFYLYDKVLRPAKVKVGSGEK